VDPSRGLTARDTWLPLGVARWLSFAGDGAGRCASMAEQGDRLVMPRSPFEKKRAAIRGAP